MTGGRAVILGPTGRNVAAGMSGGTAYVLDLDPSKVNRDMVELVGLDESDREFLLAVVREHEEETGSAVAAELLAQWDDSLLRFSKVMPTDYKRVLDARERAAREGLDVDTAVMESAHG
jgi:glutamate synthase (NADPH/NADH) large chain